MADFSIGNFLAIMIGINVVLGLVQVAILDVNPDADSFVQFNGTPASAFTGGGLSDGLTASKDDIDIVTADAISPDTGGIFTDNFKTIRAWWSKLDEKFGLLTAILKQPYGFIKDIGVPADIATAFGILWYSIVSLLLIEFFKGGDAN